PRDRNTSATSDTKEGRTWLKRLREWLTELGRQFLGSPRDRDERTPDLPPQPSPPEQALEPPVEGMPSGENADPTVATPVPTELPPAAIPVRIRSEGWLRRAGALAVMLTGIAFSAAQRSSSSRRRSAGLAKPGKKDVA